MLLEVNMGSTTRRVNKTMRTQVFDVIRFNLPNFDDISRIELESLIRLCIVAIQPNGDEDVRKFASNIDLDTLENFRVNRNRLFKTKLISKIMPILLIEWAFKSGLLVKDWDWKWYSNKVGDLKYQEKTCLDQFIGDVN